MDRTRSKRHRLTNTAIWVSEVWSLAFIDRLSIDFSFVCAGMAVAGARFFGNNMSYAAGAPRSENHGQVVIFSKGVTAVTDAMIVSMILDGEQFGSSFGYELITADVNGDGLSDLLVAAPFYFSRDEGGAVYVYLNDNHQLPKQNTQKLTGKLESRFGLAMANMGDINKDNYEDVAIGAPYEDNGVVYIYLGSKTGLNVKPAQIIKSSDLGLNLPTIKTFGSSLSGGIDLDNNSYPDLLIGAYQSAAAIILLSRPITNIRTEVRSTELNNIDPQKQGCESDPGTNLTCFSFKACCAIEPYGTSPKQVLNLLYTIEAETFNAKKKFSRVFFGPDVSNKRPNVVRRNIQVYTNGIMNCHEEIVYVKEGTRDIQNTIQVSGNHFFLTNRVVISSVLILLVPTELHHRRELIAIIRTDSIESDIGSNRSRQTIPGEFPKRLRQR